MSAFVLARIRARTKRRKPRPPWWWFAVAFALLSAGSALAALHGFSVSATTRRGRRCLCSRVESVLVPLCETCRRVDREDITAQVENGWRPELRTREAA